MSNDLHPLEAKVLKSLADSRAGGTIEALSDALNMNKDQLSKGLQMLVERKYVDENVVSQKIVEFKQKGKEVVEKGLPERRLFVSIAQPTSIPELLKKSGLTQQEFNIALGILKAGKVIVIDKGIISIINEFLSEEEKLIEWLQKDNSVENIPERLQLTLKELVARGLVGVEEKQIRTYEINKYGLAVASYMKDGPDAIDQLNSKIIISGDWKSKKFRSYNLNAKVPDLYSGKRQPYMKFLEQTKAWLVSSGFTEMEGPLVETSFWNSDALFMPQNHPARGIHDIYFVKGQKGGYVDNKKAFERVGNVHENVWKTSFSADISLSLILRSQGTALSARTCASAPNIPGKYFAIARVFRPDILDATHLVEFNQAEGIILGKELNFRNLLGVLKDYAINVAGADDVWFRPGYFPFTEPSVEMFAKLGNKWLELGGAGLFRPEVVKPLVGRDVQVIAWGLGIDRMFMIKNKIKDIRYLFAQDIQWLRGAR